MAVASVALVASVVETVVVTIRRARDGGVAVIDAGVGAGGIYNDALAGGIGGRCCRRR